MFNYFYGSGYPRIIEYRDGYPKSGYPETTYLYPDIKSKTDMDPDTLNSPDTRIPSRSRQWKQFYLKSCLFLK